MKTKGEAIICTFCNRSDQDEDVTSMLVGNDGAICNHCVEVAYASIHPEKADPNPPGDRGFGPFRPQSSVTSS
jgi:hypothetical protein